MLDTARAAAADLGLPVVNCPTVASSDAPCSALSVIYSDEGVFQEYRFYRKNPDLVLVDTAVIAQASPRLLVAGMGDALATWFEARTCVAGHVKNMRGGGSTHSAAALAELCYKTLLEDGAAALRAVETQVVTPALERLVEANTLLSGLGFESSGLAAAHAVHNGLTVAPGSHHYLHGEKVAFGLLVQLVMEGAPRATVEQVLGFSAEVGLPMTLAEVGLAELSAICLPRLPPGPRHPVKRSIMSPSKSRRTWLPMPYLPPTRSAEHGRVKTLAAERGCSSEHFLNRRCRGLRVTMSRDRFGPLTRGVQRFIHSMGSGSSRVRKLTRKSCGARVSWSR